MNVIERLVVKLVGDSSSFNKMMDNAKGKALGLAKGMISVGTMLTKYVTLPLLALGAVSVSAFAQFDKAMTESLSIMQVTQAETAKMTQLALNLGQQGVQGPEKLAQAYFYLASAGMNAQQSMAALPTVQAFATAGNFDLAKATDLVTDAQSALGLEMDKQGKNMKRVSDVFVAANTLANATVEQFSTAITTKAGASMRAFGKDVEEGVAVLAAFADQGVKAELAGNALDRMLRLLATSAIDNADAHARLGFKVYDASGNMRNMADIIQNLESILEGMSDKQRTATLTALGFEARVQQVILPLLGASEAVRSYEERLRDMSGITEEVANKQMKSFYNQTVRLYNQMKVLAIQIGQVLAPYVQWLADQVAVAVKWFTSMDEVQQRWIIGLGAAAAAAGPLLVVTGLLVGAFALFGAEIIAITAYLASWALVAGVWLGAAAAGIYLGNVIAQNSKAMRDYNDAVKENMRLEGKVVERLAARQQGQLDKAAGLSGANKNSFVNQAIASEQKELEGYQEQVRRAKQRVDELNTSWNSATGNKILEEAKLELDQARAKADMTERHIQSLKDTLEKPVTNVGLEEALGGDGALEKMQAQMQAEQELQALRARGAAITEQYLTPYERYKDTIAELDGLLEQATISEETYNRAKEAAEKTYDNATQAERNKLLQEGEVLTNKYMTAEERIAKEEERINRLYQAQAISIQTRNKALQDLQKQAEEAAGGQELKPQEDKFDVNLAQEQVQALRVQADGKEEDHRAQLVSLLASINDGIDGLNEVIEDSNEPQVVEDLA